MVESIRKTGNTRTTTVTVDDGTGTVKVVLPPSTSVEENSNKIMPLKPTSKRRKLSSFKSPGPMKLRNTRVNGESPFCTMPQSCRNCGEDIKVGSLVEVMGELAPSMEVDENVENKASKESVKDNNRNIDKGVDLMIKASSVVVIQDPNFESLRMMEISSQPAPNLMHSAKKMDINKLLEGLTEGDFESMSQT